MADWESAPVVEDENKSPAWATAPVVEEPKATPTGIEDATAYGQQVSTEPTPEAERAAVAQHPILENAAQAAVNVGKGFVQGVLPKADLPTLTEVLFPPAIGPIESYKLGRGIVDTVKQVQEADKTPPFSRERFEAGFNVVGQLGMAALGVRGAIKPKLSEALGFEKPEAPPVKAPIEKIAQSAFKLPSGEVVGTGAFHQGEFPQGSEAGFISTSGRFLGREEAGQLATGLRQPLYAEDFVTNHDIVPSLLDHPIAADAIAAGAQKGVPPFTEEPLIETATAKAEQLAKTEGAPNAVQKPESPQPDGLRTEPQVPQETQAPAAGVGGERVPEIRQGTEVPGGAQEVAPTERLPYSASDTEKTAWMQSHGVYKFEDLSPEAQSNVLKNFGDLAEIPENKRASELQYYSFNKQGGEAPTLIRRQGDSLIAKPAEKAPSVQPTGAAPGEAGSGPVSPVERSDFERGSVHINIRGHELDPNRPLSGWVLPAERGDFPNAMNTKYAKPGMTAVYVPEEFVRTSKTRPARIKEGYTPPPENVAVIPPEAIRPSGTVDWTKVFQKSSKTDTGTQPVSDTSQAAPGEAGSGPVSEPRIIAAAIRDKDTGEIWSGPSHPSIYGKIPNVESRNLDRGGFVTDKGDYITDQNTIDKLSGKKNATAQKIFGQFLSAEDIVKMERAADTGTQPVSKGEQAPTAVAEQPKIAEPTTTPQPTAPNSPTSLKNAVVDQEREARGLPSVVQPARQGFGELWDRVSKKIDENPNYPDEVIQKLKTEKGAMTPDEDAALLHRQIDLQNQYQKANQSVIDARAAGDDTALAEASARSMALSDQLLEVYDVGRAGGRATALGLNARKLLANEDFSLGNMITQKRADKMGAELTPDEVAQVTKQYNDINAKRIALDAYETSPRAESYRKQLQKWTDEYKQKTAAGDFSPKLRRPLLLDAEGQKLKSDFERSKIDWQRARVVDQAANRTPSQKFWDRFVGVERAMKLSSDVVLAKLTAAAGVRELGLTPAEQAVGSVTRRIIPGIAAKAPRYGGGFSLDSEINAKQQMFTQGMKDAWQNLKMKQTDLDELYKTGKIKAPDEFYDYMGYLHGALKAPIKRAEFARSLTERMKWAARNGQDLNSQPVMRQLSEQAYVDANRSIFLQDNIVSKGFNMINKWLETQKINPAAGAALSRINRFLIPIVKVPSNIVGEVAEGIHGVGSGGYKAAKAYVQGINTLDPARADLIMRQINKGLIGNALILTGYLLRNKIGGFYHDQDKRSPTDVQPGRYRIGNVDLPASAGHSTGAMLLNIGATIGRVAGEQQKKTSPETKGVGEGLRAAGAGLAHEIPFVPAVTGITDAMDSKGGFQKWINGMITSTTTPALLSHIAKIADTPGTFPQNALQEAVKRKPTTPVEALKMGIPGLRQQVPTREEVQQRNKRTSTSIKAFQLPK